MGELRSEKEAFPTWSEKLPFPPSGQKNCPFPKTEHYGENGLFCRAGYKQLFGVFFKVFFCSVIVISLFSWLFVQNFPKFDLHQTPFVF